jgi:hypothetical protein
VFGVNPDKDALTTTGVDPLPIPSTIVEFGTEVIVPHSNCTPVTPAEFGVTDVLSEAVVVPRLETAVAPTHAGPGRLPPTHFQMVPLLPTAHPSVAEQNDIRYIYVVSGVVCVTHVAPPFVDVPHCPPAPRKTTEVGVA